MLDAVPHPPPMSLSLLAQLIPLPSPTNRPAPTKTEERIGNFEAVGEEEEEDVENEGEVGWWFLLVHITSSPLLRSLRGSTPGWHPPENCPWWLKSPAH